MFDKKNIEKAKEESLKLFHDLSTEKGFIASSVDIDNYKRVFSRDGVIAGLSTLYFDDQKLIETFKQTLLTLYRHQDETGRIASNISLDEQKVSYGTTVGRIDATIWYIIGCCKFYLHTTDEDFLNEITESVQKALHYLKCLELNGRGLIYVPPGGDWADEYINEGYVLFDEALYLIALKYYAKVFDDTDVVSKSENLKKILKVNFFPSKQHADSPEVYQANLYKKNLKNYVGPMPLASFSAFGANYYDDLFSVSVIFNTDLLNFEEKHEIEKYLESQHSVDFAIYPAFQPVINDGDANWEKLNNNYIFRMKNKPNEYHNGGRWSMVHGFYLNSKNEISQKEMVEFAKILERDNFIFPEFYHGENHQAMGTEKLGFTAAGYLLAYQKFISNNSIFKL